MNKLDLQERVCVVTGGSGAIGCAIAERFVASGAKVVLWCATARTAAEKVRAVLAAQVDVTDAGSVAAAAKDAHARLGSIDVLINAAGINGAIRPRSQQEGRARAAECPTADAAARAGGPC
jgi:3-oxoacyl-[acyl-carrier protein] reductase